MCLKAGGPMMTDVMGNQIDLGIASVAALSANVKGGKLRALAITGEHRSPVMPEVRTLAEQGFPGFSAYAWWGILAPAGTPKPIVDKLHAELVEDAGPAGPAQAAHRDPWHGPRGQQPRGAAEIRRGRDGSLGEGRPDNNVRAD